MGNRRSSIEGQVHERRSLARSHARNAQSCLSSEWPRQPQPGPEGRKVFASEELPARALGFLQGETESLWRISISMPSTISEW